MVFHTRRPVTADVEDTVYACRSCGTELIRTSVRQTPRKSAEAAWSAAFPRSRDPPAASFRGPA